MCGLTRKTGHLKLYLARFYNGYVHQLSEKECIFFFNLFLKYLEYQVCNEWNLYRTTCIIALQNDLKE